MLPLELWGIRMKQKLIVGIVAAVGVFGAQVGEGVVLCAKPRSDGTFNTSVRIREACKSREVQLDPTALGLQGEQGPPGMDGQDGAPGAQGDPGADGMDGAAGPAGDSGFFTVLDGDDNVLGKLVGTPYATVNAPMWYRILEPSSGGILMMRLENTGSVFVSSRQINAKYSQLDCGGQLYLDGGGLLDPNELFQRVVDDPLAPLFFVVQASIPPGTPYASYADGPGCVNFGGAFGNNAWTGVEVTMPFPLPITGPLQIVASP